MERSRFARLCAGIERLTVGQMRELRRRLRELDARMELLARIDARGQALERCVHCNAPALQRWGETRTGLQRLRCRGCRRTFSAATGTALARLRRPKQVQLVVADMLSRTASSCRALAARLGVDKMTVWRWRKRILTALIGVGATAAARHRRGRREALPRSTQRLTGMGQSRTGPGAVRQARPPALARLPVARRAAARRRVDMADPGPHPH